MRFGSILILPATCALLLATSAAAQPNNAPDQIAPPPGLLLRVQPGDATGQAAERAAMTWAQVKQAVQPKPLPEARPIAEAPLDADTKLKLDQADHAVMRGELFRAVRLLREVEQSFPNHTGVLRRLGVAYALSGNQIRGAVYLERVLERMPGDAGVLVLLCRHAARQGELDQLLGYAEALSDQGQAGLADYYRSAALERLGYRAASADRLKPAIEALVQVDTDKLQQGGNTDAAVLRELRVYTAMVPELRLRLGDLLLSLDQIDGAAEQYAAVKLDEASEPASVVKRRVYLALRRGNQAGAIEQAIALLSDPLAKADDAGLVGYLASQGVARQRLTERLGAVMAERGESLPLIAGLAQVADKGRVLEAAKRWLAEQSAEPETLRRAVALISFDDDDPADVAPLADLLVLTTEQMRREPSLARRYALALVGEVPAQVCLLRAVRLPAIAEADDAYRQLIAAVVYEQTLRTADAAERYRRSMTLDEALGAQVSLPLAQMAYEAGDAEAALEVLGGTGLTADWDRLELAVKALANLRKSSQAAALIDDWETRNGEDTASALLSIELIAIAGNPQQACSQLLRMINVSPLDETLYGFGLDLINDYFESFGDNHLAANMRQAFVNRLNANLPDSALFKLERAYDIYDNPARSREAEQLLRDVLAVNPDSTQAWAMLVRLYEIAGDEDAADDAHESLVDAGTPGFSRALSRASRAVSQGDMERAQRVLKHVLDLEQEGVLPGPPMDGDDAASLLQLLGSADPEADLDEQSLAMVKRFPNNVQLNNALGYQWAVQGKNLLQAKAMIERAIDQGGGNHSVLDSLAWVQYKLGEFNQAEATQRRAIDLLREQQLRNNDQMSSSKAVLYDHMGDIQYKKGETASAVRYWQIARAQRLDEEDLMFDPELRTLAKRVDAKISAVRDKAEPPVEPVPGPEAHGQPGHPADNDQPGEAPEPAE